MCLSQLRSIQDHIPVQKKKKTSLNQSSRQFDNWYRVATKKMKLADDRKIKVEPLVKNTDVIVLSHLSHGKIQGMLTWHPFSVLAFPRSRSGLWITCDVKTQVLHCYCLRLRLLFTFSTPHNTIRTALNPLCETF